MIKRTRIRPRADCCNDKASLKKLSTSGLIETVSRLKEVKAHRTKFERFHFGPLKNKKDAISPMIPITIPNTLKLVI